MHVDIFTDSRKTDRYASWFFALKRMPAFWQNKFDDYISRYQLYCDYKGERYRVTGASSLGDVWLTKDFSQSVGYQLRVDVSECLNFSDTSQPITLEHTTKLEPESQHDNELEISLQKVTINALEETNMVVLRKWEILRQKIERHNANVLVNGGQLIMLED